MQEQNINVIDEGYVYEVNNFESGRQIIKFIKKEWKDGDLETIHDGVTNELLIGVLINRLEFLNNKLHSDYNVRAIAFLKGAADELLRRTTERKENGTEGTINN